MPQSRPVDGSRHGSPAVPWARRLRRLARGSLVTRSGRVRGHVGCRGHCPRHRTRAHRQGRRALQRVPVSAGTGLPDGQRHASGRQARHRPGVRAAARGVHALPGWATAVPHDRHAATDGPARRRRRSHRVRPRRRRGRADSRRERPGHRPVDDLHVLSCPERDAVAQASARSGPAGLLARARRRGARHAAARGQTRSHLPCRDGEHAGVAVGRARTRSLPSWLPHRVGHLRARCHGVRHAI